MSAKNQQETLHYLLKYSREAFFSVDTQWRILALNRQAELLCQKSPSQLLGQSLWNAFPAIAAPVFTLKAQEAFQRHTTVEDTFFLSECNAWFAIRLYPAPTGFVLFLQEITRWKQAEEAKHTNELFAQAILDSLDVRIAVLDSTGTICAINDAWKREAQEACTSADQLERTGLGMNYLEVCQQAQGVIADEAPEAFEGIQAVLRGTQPSFALEYPCFSATEQRWYMLRVTPLERGQGAVVAHIDITERKFFDQQKDTFIALAAHELRTPLTAIKMLVQLGKKKEEKQGKGDAKDKRSQVEEQIERLAQLIAELLDVSKMQAGMMDYVEEEINLDEIINEVVTTTYQTNPKYTLNVHGLPSHAIIKGDRNKLNQVFLNLVSNAIKYSPGVNIIDISVESVQDTAFVRIQDYGIGIPHQHHDHIFERFYRVSTSKRSHAPGLGLGLSIAHEIVKHHQGTITVTSEEGKGSIFSVQLPLCCR